MYNPILWECNCHIDDKVVDDLMSKHVELTDNNN